MAHFAKISEENIVLNTVVVADKDCQDAEGNEQESIGQAFMERCGNWPAHLWIKTSYNTKFNEHSSGDNSKAYRGNYAGIGFIWDSANQIFWEPQPYGSWVKDTTTAKWKSPIGEPPELSADQLAENQSRLENGHNARWQYEWNETVHQADNTQGWVIVDEKDI